MLSFGARYVANIIEFAGQQGANRLELLALLNMSMADLDDPELRIPLQAYNEVAELAVERTGDQYFGLHLGNHLSLSAAGLITQIVQNCRTVAEAIHYIIEFANLGCQALPFTLSESPEYCILSIDPNSHWLEQSPLSVRHTMDGVLIFTLRELHSLTHRKYQPLKVQLGAPKPVSLEPYTRLFNCPVEYSSNQASIFLDRAIMDVPVVTSDYRLLQILVKYAEEQLARLHHHQQFSSQVKQAMIHLINPTFPQIEVVAQSLNLSVRSLQRRLSEEATSYKALLNELRAQFAQDYLKNDKLSIKEIAYLLDYRDTSSFVRAFRRWKGQSPLAYRRQTQLQ